LYLEILRLEVEEFKQVEKMMDMFKKMEYLHRIVSIRIKDFDAKRFVNHVTLLRGRRYCKSRAFHFT